MQGEGASNQDDAKYYVDTGRDKEGLDIRYISAFKGRGIFTTAAFEKGDFLLEYRGELITKEECESRQRLYHDSLKMMTEEHQIQTNPVPVPLKGDGQDLDEEIPQKGSETIHSPSTVEDFEEMMTEDHQIQIPEDSQIQTNPVPVPLKGDGQMMTEDHQIQIPEDSQIQTNPVPVPLKGDGQMTTENNQNLFTSPSQMDPSVNSEKCQNHRLVCTTISALDKCIQCVGPVSSLKWLGYKCRDKIAVSDAEAKDSESESDDGVTTFTASECATRETVDAASDSANTEQVKDAEENAGAVPLVTSTVNETVPLSEEPDAGQEHESRRVPKKAWSKSEVAAVVRHFRDHISKGKLATKNECSHCKLVEGPVLAQRTVQNIRDFVRNRGIAAKRQSQKQKL